jgi:hypothetical protein
MSAFYSDPAIRQRLIEYLGGDTLDSATAVFITHSDGCLFQRSELRPPSELKTLLDLDIDIARSLADRESVLFHLDIEYVNFDDPTAAYSDPHRAFAFQEPTVRVIEELLLEWGIRPLHLITGQGHHFVWRISSNSTLAQQITALNPAPELACACHLRAGEGVTEEIRLEAQEMFTAIALPMEYIAHRIKWLAAPLSKLPVEITAVHVGPGQFQNREIVSIDISEYGDPLHTRMVRMPYTNYIKPWASGLVRDPRLGEGLPRFRTIPLFEMDVEQAIACSRNEKEVRRLARRAGTSIPFQEKGTARLLSEYLNSDLRMFHEDFYSVPHLSEDDLEEKYGSLSTLLPPCGKSLLDYPNDRLLKPAGIQLITRSLLGLGWHPRHIADLIRSKFANPDYCWGVDWLEYEPGTRADFYTRLFAGLWKTGVDELVDFNCISTMEKGFCPSDKHEHCSLCELNHTLTNPNS